MVIDASRRIACPSIEGNAHILKLWHKLLWLLPLHGISEYSVDYRIQHMITLITRMFARLAMQTLMLVLTYPKVAFVIVESETISHRIVIIAFSIAIELAFPTERMILVT